MKLYQHIASLVIARKNCEENKKAEWYDRHGERLDALCREFMPSGNGFDRGCQLLTSIAERNKLTFTCAYHKMDEHGYYDGWLEFLCTVEPDLYQGFCIEITGLSPEDEAAHGDYLHDMLRGALCVEVDTKALYDRKSL